LRARVQMERTEFVPLREGILGTDIDIILNLTLIIQIENPNQRRWNLDMDTI